MNYDEVIQKVNRLEETLDLFLVETVVNPAAASPELRRALDRASKRKAIRDRDAAIREEYDGLKWRMAEMETDYPFLRK